MFQGHLALLKFELCFEKFIGLENEWVKILTIFYEGKFWCFNFFFQNYYEKWPCCYTGTPVAMQPYHWTMVQNCIQYPFVSLTFRVFCIGKGCNGYGFREHGRQILFLHFILQEIKIMESVNHTLWFGCENVCTKPLHFGYLSFWGCNQRLGK